MAYTAQLQHQRIELSNGTHLQVRVCQPPEPSGAGVLVFVHGFPEAAFVWDGLLAHFSDPANGGYTCVAPNLRGFAESDSPSDVNAYKPNHLVDDLTCLASHYSANQPLQALVAHDWGGAVAWNLAAAKPELMQRLMIINAPHPATFLRELRTNPAQQAASVYMNYLARPDAEALLSANDFAKLWPFFNNQQGRTPAWLTDTIKDQFRAVWRQGLAGGCNYYRASPLRPSTDATDAVNSLSIPDELTRVDVPTTVLWGLQDHALLPGLLQGLDQHVPKLRLQTVSNASHWLIHEQPQLVIENLSRMLRQP